MGAKHLNEVPAHYKSLLRNVTTVPNLMGHFRAVLIVAMLHAHIQGNSIMVFVAYIMNLIVIDNLDGIVARRLQQCTSLGRVLDMGLDVCSESLLLGCICTSLLASTSSLQMQPTMNLHLLAFIVLDRCVYVVCCFASIGVTFAGVNWKEIRYPCPLTRWYYETNIGGYGLYSAYHLFVAAVYLFVNGVQGSSFVIAVTAPGFVSRYWCNIVGNFKVVQVLMELDAERFASM